MSGAEVRAIRARLGLTQAAFAEAINAAAPGARVNRFNVARWESGRVTPSPPMAAIIRQLAK